jgi:glutamate-5-semialdehyde dehydrogenase
MTDSKSVTQIASSAKAASLVLAGLSTETKNKALLEMASALEANTKAILEANRTDVAQAEKDNLAKPLLARLALSESKVAGMAKGIRSVAALPDPVGQKLLGMEMDKDLTLYQVSCPIGVIGAIFESRPDAVPQISSLCLKSGNAVVLKGGMEAQNSNKLIVSLLVQGIEKVSGVPAASVQMIETRSQVSELLDEEENIQLIVPRGSNEFVRYIQENTKIPVLGHSEGICHGYVDQNADVEMAIKIALDSKLQYPAACNAMETLLIHEAIAPKILPGLFEKFNEEKVKLVGCLKTQSLIPQIQKADDSDWDTEYTDLKLSIKIVSSFEEAVAHINKHGSGHTDVIVTEDNFAGERFQNEVDSASVMVNASTRFADGFRFGLGAEIGISTNKTHARGPVGLEGLVIYKYKVTGKGQTVSEYSGDGGREFTHRLID